MSFSVRQWLFAIVLDLFLKAGLVYPVLGVGYGAAIVLGWWVFQFVSLFPACGFVALLNLNKAAKFWLTLVVSAILFAGSTIAMWILSIKNGHETGCTGIEMRCDWINGEITPDGVQTIALFVFIMIVGNSISILTSAAFGNLASRIRQSLRAKTAIKD